jgi:hypothetical protein
MYYKDYKQIIITKELLIKYVITYNKLGYYLYLILMFHNLYINMKCQYSY